jgi:hypothetical protein
MYEGWRLDYVLVNLPASHPQSLDKWLDHPPYIEDEVS